MDSQIPRPHGSDHEENIPGVDLPSVTEGGNEPHQEKTSMMQKVKAKAKKIKESMKKHGRGHGQDGDLDKNQHDQSHGEEEFQDVDEEMVEDPDVHDAPVNESAAVMSGITGQKPGVNLDKATVAAKDQYNSKYTDPPTRPFEQSQDEISRESGANMGRPTATGEANHVPENKDVLMDAKYTDPPPMPFEQSQDEISRESGASAGRPIATGETDHVPKNKDVLMDAKYTDPPSRPFAPPQDENSGKLGANVARPTAMEVADQVPEKTDVLFDSGTYGTPSSESTGNFLDAGEGNKRNPKIDLGTSTAVNEDPHAFKDRTEVSTHHTKVTDPTGAGAEEAGITPILQSVNKMSVYDESEQIPNPTEAPNLFTGSHDQSSPEPLPPHTTTNPENPELGLKSFDASSNPENIPQDTVVPKQPSDQTTYTENISSATPAIDNQAIAAKNDDVSKLGYGGTDEDCTAPPKIEPVSGGKVTESEEVKERLGSGDGEDVSETEARVPANVSPTGKTMVESVKGALSSWWNPKGEDQTPRTPQPSPRTTDVGERFPSSTGEADGHHGQDSVLQSEVTRNEPN